MSKKASKKTKENHNQQKKFYLISGIIAAISLLILSISMFTIFHKDSEITASKLVKDYAKNSSYVKNIVEQDDSENLIGKNNEYLTKASWDDGRIENSKTEDHAGTIEVFKNSKDAEIREWYFDKNIGICNQYISIQKYGEETNKEFCDGPNYGNTYRNGVVILRLSKAYSNEQSLKYKNNFFSLVDKYSITEKDIPSNEDIANIKEQKEKNLKSTYEQQEKDLKKSLDDTSSRIDDSIHSALAKLQDTELKKLKEDIAYAKTIPYFSNKISTWENQLLDLESKIAAHKAEEAQKAAEAKQAEKAAKARTFSAGKYIVGKDIETGKYDITAISGSGNLFISNAYGRSVLNEIMSPTNNDFYTASYKNAYLGTNYEIEIRSNLVLEFTVAD